MGLPVTGAFARATQSSAPYAGAAKWGTGISAIHGRYDGPPRPFGPGVPNDMDDRTPPFQAADDVEYGPPWGAPDDPSYLDSVADESEALNGEPWNGANDGWNDWGMTIEDGSRASVPASYPSWNEGGGFIRTRPMGSVDRDHSNLTPTETVTEGWRNKATGAVARSEPADDSQVFVQTSQTQRFREQDNDRALMRSGPHSDVARTPIKSRVAGQIVKVYSGEERHYDMFPRQIDDIPRPFYFRTAGTGPNPYLYNNEMRLVSPLQRTPPPDPSQGIVDTALTNPDDAGSYGYTSEEWGYG